MKALGISLKGSYSQRLRPNLWLVSSVAVVLGSVDI